MLPYVPHVSMQHVTFRANRASGFRLQAKVLG